MGRGRESKSVISRRPEGFGSSEFHQIVYLLMLYRLRWVSGAVYGKVRSFWHRMAESLKAVEEKGGSLFFCPDM